MPPFEQRIAQQEARCVMNRFQRRQAVRMVGDNKEIERAGESCLHPHCCSDFFAAGKAQCFFRTQPDAEGKGI